MDQPSEPDDRQRDGRDEREVHPALGSHLGRDRDEARRGREGEKEEDAEDAEAGNAPQRERREREQRQDQPGLRQDRGPRQRQRPAVIEDEIARPQREPQVASNHDRLVEQVGPDVRVVRREAGRQSARRAPHQAGEDEPGRGQAGVETPSRPDGLADRAKDEGAIVEDDRDRRGDHRFLAAHAQRARCDGRRLPAAAGGSRPVRADRAIECRQVTQRHQRLGPLRDVVDRLGVERMDRPDERDGECRRVRRLGAARDAEQRQGAQHVNRDVDEVVAGDFAAAERVVHREREVHGRAPGNGGLPRRHQHLAAAEVFDGGVVDDRAAVVEDEGPGEAVGVSGHRGDGQESRQPPRAAARRRLVTLFHHRRVYREGRGARRGG